jgi:hypothetical protein
VLAGFASAKASKELKSDKIEGEINTVLDGFHLAASKADGKAYFSYFAPEGIFIGTDADEHWTVDEFKEYAKESFAKGKGWTYDPKVRHIDLSPDMQVAWFYEILENAAFGTCRGSGVLRKIKGSWKISQYHLTIPVPNDLAGKVASMIRETGKQPQY